MTDVFVRVDNDVTLTGFDGKRSDFISKFPSFLGSFCFVLRGNSECVLHFTADLPFLGNVFSGLTHVVTVERVPKAIADHGIDIFHIAHFMTGTQMRGMWAKSHVFLSTSGDNVRVTQLDVLSCQCNGAQSRTANLIN